ncbi:MAG: hypothetical protein ISS34_04665 [Candidatus Omnitrophica bacterium]|nr:hypothetical protein [Candidatus Omnitrophota bacterium]
MNVKSVKKNNQNSLLNGILLLYHYPLNLNASTIMEYVNAFERYSKFKVLKVNTAFGFPKALKAAKFQTIVLHYSLFGTWPFMLNSDFLEYLNRCRRSYKIAIFQDEFQYCKQRFGFINHYKIDSIYTLIKPEYFKDVYRKYTSVSKIIHIPFSGYVSEELIRSAKSIVSPDSKRKIDIGYRGRELAFYMGKGAREKYDIAAGFRERAKGLRLKNDIKTDEESRIYGKDWYKFLADCRATLGAESGASIFDIDGTIYDEYLKAVKIDPKITFNQMWEKFLHKWENNIPNRTFSQRHFEAAALQTCQILFEGGYSGVMRPMVHYIPLRKDFSNFDEVIGLFKDGNFRRQIVKNAYQDLILSERYTYKRFIEVFDMELLKGGFKPKPIDFDADKNYALITKELSFLYKKHILRKLYSKVLCMQFPSRRSHNQLQEQRCAE